MDSIQAEIGRRNHRFFRRWKAKWPLFQKIDDVAEIKEKQDCLFAIKHMQIVHAQISQFAQDFLQLGVAAYSFSSCIKTLSRPSPLGTHSEQKVCSFQSAAKELEEKTYTMMTIIYDHVLQPLERRTQMLSEILILIRERDEKQSDYEYYKRLHIRSRHNQPSFESVMRQKRQLDLAQQHCEHVRTQLRNYIQTIGGSFAYQHAFTQQLVETLDSILQEHCHFATHTLARVVLL